MTNSILDTDLYKCLESLKLSVNSINDLASLSCEDDKGSSLIRILSSKLEQDYEKLYVSVLTQFRQPNMAGVEEVKLTS